MTMLVETPSAEVHPALITPQGGVRCWNCGRRYMNRVTAPYEFVCRCKAVNKDE